MDDVIRLAAVEAIRQAVLRYCRGVDRLDVGVMQSAYLPGAVEDVEAMVDLAVTAHDGLRIGVNAAAIEFETQPVADCEDDDFDRIIAVNLRSVFLCMKHEARAMRASGRGGSIVNIASTNAFRPQPHQPAYTRASTGFSA